MTVGSHLSPRKKRGAFESTEVVVAIRCDFSDVDFSSD